MRLIVVLRCAVVLYTCLLLGTTSAQADDVEEARVLFNAGGGASAAGRFDEARSYFQRSAALVPKATTYLNLAVAEIRLGLGREALASLDNFDRLAHADEHEPMMTRARSLRRMAEELAAKQAPTVTPVAPPVVESAQVESARPVEAERAIPPRTAAPLAPIAAEPATHARFPWLVPAAFFAGAAISAGGTYRAGKWWHERSGALDACDSRSPPCSNRGDVEGELRAAQTVTLVTGATALALTVAGVWWLVRHRPSATQSWLPTPLGIGARF